MKIYKNVNKNQVLLDVSKKYEEDVEEIFPKKDITFKERYINTTYHNQMTMYLIKIDILKNEEEI